MNNLIVDDSGMDIFFNFIIKNIKNGFLEMLIVYMYLKFKV